MASDGGVFGFQAAFYRSLGGDPSANHRVTLGPPLTATATTCSGRPALSITSVTASSSVALPSRITGVGASASFIHHDVGTSFLHF